MTSIPIFSFIVRLKDLLKNFAQLLFFIFILIF